MKNNVNAEWVVLLIILLLGIEHIHILNKTSSQPISTIITLADLISIIVAILAIGWLSLLHKLLHRHILQLEIQIIRSLSDLETLVQKQSNIDQCLKNDVQWLKNHFNIKNSELLLWEKKYKRYPLWLMHYKTNFLRSIENSIQNLNARISTPQEVK